MSVLFIALLILAVVFAQVEVHIEGEHGWAAKLPTWRIEKHPLLDLFFGGRPITGYHVWMFLFMALVFHLPLAMVQRFDAVLEARIIGSLGVFWVLEDFLWFVINPAYGLRRFRKQHVPWHRHWWGPAPVDYFALAGVGLALILWSYRT
jgi:hypothetical protein